MADGQAGDPGHRQREAGLDLDRGIAGTLQNSSLKFCWPKMSPICALRLIELDGTGVPSTASMPIA